VSTDRLATYRRLVGLAAFRPYLAGALTSQLGDAMASLGFLLLVFQSTHSAAMTTGVVVAEAAPYVLFGLIGGALADRVPTLPALLALDVARALLQVATFVAVLTHHAPYALLLAVVFALQLGGCLFNPAHRALLPEVVPSESLVAANGMLSVGATATPLLAPAVTAAALTTVGAAGFFALDAVTYMVSVACLLRLQNRWPAVRRLTGSVTVSGTLRQVGDFMAVARADALLRTVLLTTFTAVLLSTWARLVGLLLIAEGSSANGGQVYAALLGVHAAMGLLVGVGLPLLARRLGLFHYLAGAAVWGAGIAATGLGLGVGTLVVAVALQGSGAAVAGASRSFLLQTEVDASMRGQGFAAAAVLLYLADLLSVAVFGILATALPADALTLSAGVSLMLVATWHLLRRRGGSELRVRTVPTVPSHPGVSLSATLPAAHKR
jgi:DHA3 family macrolide efflux protein-like MFS transporter